MFFEWLEKQRNRSESERWMFAIVTAGVLTGLLVIAWLPARAVLDGGQATVRISDDSQPWADTQNEFSGALSQFKEQFNALQEGASLGEVEADAPAESLESEEEPAVPSFATTTQE